MYCVCVTVECFFGLHLSIDEQVLRVLSDLPAASQPAWVLVLRLLRCKLC